MVKIKNQYRFGRLKEQRVAQRLRSAGAHVKLSKGSKGAEDMIAVFKSKKWLVQSKATRQGSPNQPSSKDIGRLKQKATKMNATPVIAEVLSNNQIKFKSARNGRKLKS